MTFLKLQKLERKSLATEVYELLKQNILSGALPPGTRLLEAQIADQMVISRAPVREALRMLEANRLIEIQKNQGAYVREMQEDEIWEIYTARSIIEGYVAGLAAERAKPDDIERLKKTLDTVVKAAEKEDIEATIAADYENHRVIWEISGHRILYDILTHLDVQIRMFMAVQAPLFSHLLDSVKGHSEIVEAIANGDAETAKRCMQQHIIEAGMLALKQALNEDVPSEVTPNLKFAQKK